MWTYKGQVHSDWVLYQGTERNADTVVTPQTDYEKAMRIFKSTQTEKAFSENTQLVKILKEYLP